MSLNKKIAFSLTSLMLAISVAACSSSNVPSSASIESNVDFSKQINNTQVTQTATLTKVVKDSLSDEHVFIDVGNGQKTGASLTFSLNLNSGFKTKATVNSNGSNGTATSVRSIRCWLVQLPTHSIVTNSPVGGDVQVLPGANVATANVAGSVFDYNNGTSNPTITFSNVPASSTSPQKSYYVAVAPYNVVGNHTTDATHSTNLNSGNNIAATTGSNWVVEGGSENSGLSQTGGDSALGTNQAGSLTVDSTFAVSTTNPLGVNIKLADAFGASIGTDVSFTNGSGTIPAVGGGGAN